MVRKVKITDADTGEALRETYAPAIPMFFGFLTASDLLKVISAMVAFIIFFVNGQNDKKLMQDNLTAMQISVTRLTDFRDNSDAFNTLVYGTKIKDGQPVDPSFKVTNITITTNKKEN